MGEFAREKAGVPAPKDSSPTPAPAPKDGLSWADVLDRATATATWVEKTIVPSLERQAAGEPQMGSALDLVAYDGLATIKAALERTSPLAHPNLEGFETLVKQRARLHQSYEGLRAKVDSLAKAIHAQPARPKPVVNVESPGGPPKPKPRPMKGPKASFTKHAAGPVSINFGKVAPNKAETLSVPIFNLVPQVATAAVYYEGSSAILLRGAPASLYPAGYQIPDGAQHVMLQFNAPAARGAHRGSIRIDLSWPKGIKPETLTIPVVAHSALPHEATDDEIRADVARQQRERAEDDARAKKVKQADDELAAFDRAYPAFRDNRFDDKVKALDSSIKKIEEQQAAGIARAAREIMKYRKAEQPAERNVLFELAMTALDIASAGFANIVAKGIERSLLNMKKAADAAKTARHPLSKTVILGDSTVYGISDAVKEGLKITSRRARATPGSKPGSPAPRRMDNPNFSDDPRIAFLEIVAEEHSARAHERRLGFIRATALLRPTLFKDPALAVAALERLARSVSDESEYARTTYYEATIRRWFGFISELRLDVHRVGSVDGHAIRPVRGVVDIGFQAGRSPRDPVKAKSAIMRGVSNAALKTLRAEPLLGADVPIRLFGLPSPNHAELLVTVTRAPDGTVNYLDQSNGSAPGPGQWLKTRGKGDPKAGAVSLLEEVLSRSLAEQNIELTSDQDPAVEDP